MKKMALFVFILMVVFVFSGCLGGEKKTETSADQKTPTSEQAVETPDTSGGSQADPVFKDYEYPGSKLEYSTKGGGLGGGRVTIASYTSTDDFGKVVEFYKQKFQGEGIITTDYASFGNENPDRVLGVIVALGNDDVAEITLQHASIR